MIGGWGGGLQVAFLEKLELACFSIGAPSELGGRRSGPGARRDAQLRGETKAAKAKQARSDKRSVGLKKDMKRKEAKARKERKGRGERNARFEAEMSGLFSGDPRDPGLTARGRLRALALTSEHRNLVEREARQGEAEERLRRRAEVKAAAAEKKSKGDRELRNRTNDRARNSKKMSEKVRAKHLLLLFFFEVRYFYLSTLPVFCVRRGRKS